MVEIWHPTDLLLFENFQNVILALFEHIIFHDVLHVKETSVSLFCHIEDSNGIHPRMIQFDTLNYFD